MALLMGQFCSMCQKMVKDANPYPMLFSDRTVTTFVCDECMKERFKDFPKPSTLYAFDMRHRGEIDIKIVVSNGGEQDANG